jgi:hypothetical protein
MYPYPGGLLTAGSAGHPNAGSVGGNSVSSSLESVLKNGMNMQTVQLEWLARTGMLYHRFPELAGNLSPKIVYCLLLFLSYSALL